MISINFEYKIKGSIKIKSLNTIGIIVGYYVGDTGIQYQVAYFLNGERKSIYLYSEEIEEADSGTMVGFIK